MVERLFCKEDVESSILLSQLLITRSLIGKTPDFESGIIGSRPVGLAKLSSSSDRKVGSQPTNLGLIPSESTILSWSSG